MELSQPVRVCLGQTVSDFQQLRVAGRHAAACEVPGNTKKARVYLSTDNFNILDRQLQETYGETIAALDNTGQETRRAGIVLRKLDIPPLVVTQLLRTVVRKDIEVGAMTLTRPTIKAHTTLRQRSYPGGTAVHGERLATTGRRRHY